MIGDDEKKERKKKGKIESCVVQWLPAPLISD